MKRFLLVAVFLFVLVSPVRADLSYYGITDVINDDLTVNTEIVLEFNEPITHLDYRMNFDIMNLEARATFTDVDCEIQEARLISCDFFNMTHEQNRLTLTFQSTDAVRQTDGTFEFRANYGFLPTNRTFVVIQLPQGAILSADVANESFFPQDGGILSDGKHIKIFWERENVGEDSLQFSVSYLFPADIPSDLVIALTAVVIVVMIGIVVYARRRQEPVEVVTSVLNHDEKVIVDILKQQEGKALQKVLVRESNFSKAKISRLVKELKERGVVDTEAVSGRENRIILTMGKKQAPPQETKEENA